MPQDPDWEAEVESLRETSDRWRSRALAAEAMLNQVTEPPGDLFDTWESIVSKATEGPWVDANGCLYRLLHGTLRRLQEKSDPDTMLEWRNPHDGKFGATFDPPTVRAMIEFMKASVEMHGVVNRFLKGEIEGEPMTWRISLETADMAFVAALAKLTPYLKRGR